MKICNESLTILKNFASINPGILFKQGNTLSTVSPQKNILAEATISETIPQEFGIFDLNNFLSVISLFKDGAELEFDSKNVIIKGMDGRSKIKYRMTNPSMIVIAPDKRPNLPTVDVSFKLTEEDFNWILRSANVLNSPNVAIESDGNEVKLISFDVSDDSAHSNSVVLNDIKSDNSFRLIFKTENLKMIPGNYNVEICSKGISKFVDTNKNISYWITLETSSVYN